MTTMLLSVIRAAAVVAATMAVVACGTNDGAPAADTGAGAGAAATSPAEDVKQACEVFTLDLARQVLGESARPSEAVAPTSASSDDVTSSTCTYQADDPTPKTRFLTVIAATVTVNGARTASGRSSNRSAFEQWRQEMGQLGDPGEAVAGVGEAAHYIGGRLNQLYVLVDGGRYALIVSVMEPNDDNRGATERLAKLVIEQL